MKITIMKGDVMSKTLKRLSMVIILMSLIPISLILPLISTNENSEGNSTNTPSRMYQVVDVNQLENNFNPYTRELVLSSFAGDYTYSFVSENGLFYKDDVEIIINYSLDKNDNLVGIEIIDVVNGSTYRYNYQYFV